MNEMKTVIGLFSENEDAESALQRLHHDGYDPKDISLIMRDERQAERMRENTGADVGTGAVSGATTGAVVGGIAGLLIGIGAIAIPGIGAILIGGPLATALGLTGAAATTASGALTGALAGGLIGALMSLGLPKEEAEHYQTQIQQGAILLAVPAIEGQEQQVERILADNNATDIKVLTMDSDVVHQRDTYVDDADEDRRPVGHHDIGHHRSAQHGSDDYASPVEVQRYLKHVDYPASKNELVQEAAEEGADRTIIHTLQDLPEERFSNPTSVSRAIGSLT